jgi:hypothetical protein
VLAVRAGSVLTEVASFRVDYRGLGRGVGIGIGAGPTVRSSFSCQFHPELGPSLRDARREAPPGFAELSGLDGTQLLALFLAG